MQVSKRKAWSTVLAGALGCAAGAGVVANYAFGVFVKAIAAEYVWSRSEATLGITLFYLFSGIGSVCLGSLIARWSIRSVSVAFVSLFSLGLMGMALLPNSVSLFALTFAIVGFFASAATPMPYAIAIAGWFDRRRGLALALAVSGTALSATFMATYANWLMTNYGWRGGYVGIGLFAGGVALTGLLFLFYPPPVPARTMVPDDHASDGSPLSLMRDRIFWLFGLPIFLISVAGGGIVTNLAPLLTDRGMDMKEAAALLGVMGASTMISRLLIGTLLDYFHVRYVSSTVFFLLVVALGILLAGLDGPPLAAAAVMIGLAMGGEADLVSFGVSRYYPPEALARALGGIWICWAWGGGVGVALASAAYDLFGNYNVAMILFGAMAFGAALIILQLGAYRYGHKAATQ